MSKIKVYIASPYTLGDVAVNVRKSMMCAAALMEAGYAPYSPLGATHFQHMLSPQPYETWCALDLEWVAVCDVVLRLEGESKGADGEVAFAEEHDIPVVHSLNELMELNFDKHKLELREKRTAARRTLHRMGYEWTGGNEWQPPLGKPADQGARAAAVRTLHDMGYVWLGGEKWQQQAASWSERPMVTHPLEDAIYTLIWNTISLRTAALTQKTTAHEQAALDRSRATLREELTRALAWEYPAGQR